MINNTSKKSKQNNIDELKRENVKEKLIEEKKRTKGRKINYEKDAEDKIIQSEEKTRERNMQNERVNPKNVKKKRGKR